jgi:hypothetical protein
MTIFSQTGILHKYKTMARPPRPRDQLSPVGDLLIDRAVYDQRQHPADSGCQLWTGPFHHQGYGMIGAWHRDTNRRIMTTTHRIAARIKYDREIASSEMVVHTCTNPACVNPDHIELGDRYLVHQQRRARQSKSQKVQKKL